MILGAPIDKNKVAKSYNFWEVILVLFAISVQVAGLL